MTTPISLRLLGVGVLVATLSLLRYVPAASAFDPDAGFGYAVARVPDLTRQLADPAGWQSRPQEAVALRWRLLPPTVGHWLHLAPSSYFALPLVGAAVLLLLTLAWTFEETQSVGWSALAGMLATTSSWFFVSTGWLGQFDAFYLVGVLTVVFARSPLAVWAACALAPWCDERFLLILPACLCLRWTRTAPAARRRLLAVVAAGLAPYVCLRLWSLGHGDDSIGRQWAGQTAAFREYLRQVPVGWWMGFRAGWAPIAVGVAAAAGALSRVGRALLGLTLVFGLAAVVLLAWDVSRSIAVLFPFLIFGVIDIHRHRPALGWKILAAAAVLNLVLPASHVVETHRIPLRSIWPHAF